MVSRHTFKLNQTLRFSRPAFVGLVLAMAGSMSAYGADTTATAKPESKPEVKPAAAPASPAPGGKGRACEDVKASIASKLEAKGVKNYTLDIAARDAVGAGKVVGSCEGGKMRIVYTRK